MTSQDWHTEFDILEGRELDIKCAEMLGWTNIQGNVNGDYIGLPPINRRDPEYPDQIWGIPHYSSIESLSIQVREHVRVDPWFECIVEIDDGFACCTFKQRNNKVDEHSSTIGETIGAWGECISEAVCKAALKTNHVNNGGQLRDWRETRGDKT